MKICNKKLLMALAVMSTFYSGTLAALALNLLDSSNGGSAISGSSVTINDAIFAVAHPNTGAGSGAGAFNPFLRLQQPNANEPYETGYNTDDRSYKANGDLGPPGTNPEFDSLNSPQTRSVQVGQLAPVNIGGTDYFQLVLDLNEPEADPNKPGEGAKSTLSLLELELYVNSSTGAASSYSAGLGTKIWELDCTTIGPCTKNGEDNTINFDAAILKNGSGGYDIVLSVPFSLLSGFGLDNYFYLYNELGNVDKDSSYPYPAEATFEEWSFFARDIPNSSSSSSSNGGPPTGVPEPGTLSLLGGAMLGLLFVYRRRQQNAA